MSMMMIRVPKDKTMELKSMISEGLHIFGRAMSLAEEMCEASEMGERGGYYGNRDMDYPYGDRMGERHYPQYPMMSERDFMGERQGVRGTGRYSRY